MSFLSTGLPDPRRPKAPAGLPPGGDRNVAGRGAWPHAGGLNPSDSGSGLSGGEEHPVEWTTKRTRQRVVVAAVAAVGLMLASIAALVGYAWQVIDSAAAAQETRLVRRAIDALGSRLEHEVATAAEWDDAYVGLTTRNLAWLRKYYGKYYAGSFDHNVTVVFDTNGIPFFGQAGDRLLDAAELARFGAALRPMVRAVQDDELARRATLTGPEIADSSLTLRSGAVLVDGRPYILGVGSVIPATHFLEGRVPAPVVASGRLVDTRFEFELEHTLGLKAVKVTRRAPPVGAIGAVGLKDFRGREIAALSWTSGQPAADAARSVAKPASAILLTLLVSWTIMAFLIRRLLVALAERERSLVESVEDLSRARDVAEAALDFKSQFIANLNNEIRVPLNGILGVAQAMEAAELEPGQRQRLGVIRRSGQGLADLLDDVLDLARIEAQAFEPVQAPFDLEDLITEVMSTFEALAEAKGIAFRLDVAANACGTYISDAARIRQILHNLLGNALKFTTHGAVTLGAAYEQGVLTLSVRDTGPGIPEEQMPHLFSRAASAHGDPGRGLGGGLGLPISAAIATALGGRLGADSRPGEGAAFRLELPLERLAATTRERLAREGRAGPGGVDGARVLVADDNSVNRLLLATLLDPCGIRPHMVEDGAAAVAARRDHPFDLILMDILMPGMDGLEATRQIRDLEAREGLTRVPIIAISADASSDQNDAYLAAGMDGRLAKPVDPAALLDLVRHFTGRAPPAA